jgi:hypothetical protein
MDKDEKLAKALARQFLSTIEPSAMAGFLLEEEVAVALLAARFQKDPERTIQELQALQGVAPAQGATRRGRPPGRPTKRAAAAVGRKRGARRRRLKAAQVEQLKAQVRAYLAKHRWATRKELTAAIDLPTQAIYRRIMTELHKAGDIISKGEKAKRVYALKGGGKRTKQTKTAKKKTRKKAKAKPKTRAKTKTKRKKAAKKR